MAASLAMTTDTPAPKLGSKGPAWHAEPSERVRASVEAPAGGLSAAAARARLGRHGPNLIQHAAPEGPLAILARQLASPLVLVLLGSAALAIALGKLTDGLVVLAVVCLNTIIGFVQEHRASRAIEALLGMVPELATVLRDGERRTVPVSDLVPGDTVFLASGDKVPADMRLVESRGLRVEEAALTGESVPAEKSPAPVAAEAALGDRTSMVFGGTLVASGTGTAVVVATGSATELGRISTLLREATDLETPLTRALGEVSRWITASILFVAVAMLALGTWRATAHGVGLAEAARDTLVFAIALAVGAIPEGLPAIVTIALAIGVQRMAARRAIIRKLPATETLGSTTVICSDKTGTLTRNEMTVREVWTASGALSVDGVGYEPRGGFRRPDGAPAEVTDEVRTLLLDAALCSDATVRPEGSHWVAAGDPTEAALVVAAEKAAIRVDAERSLHRRRDMIPFESENQFMAVLLGDPEGAGPGRVVLKGAPEVLLRRCRPGSVDEGEMHRELERLAAGGMRVLAVAEREWKGGDRPLALRDTEAEFRFRGLVGMVDPPRPEAIAAVRACQAAGITVKMITGDHRATAEAIGREIGILRDGQALTGAEIGALDDWGLRRAVHAVNVFARVAPEHKLRLVKALQQEGHVVAMTGDGVNDAPALKQANIGVAMGITGTAVSKEAADVVLADDNFASIAAAVEEGRRVYDNLVKALAFVLPTNLGLALILMSAVAFFPFDPASGRLLLPMAPTQLLWINLVATVALALPLAFEAREPDVMRRPPRSPNEPVLSRFVLRRTLLVAVLMAAGALAVFHWEHERGLSQGESSAQALGEAQTMAVTTVIMFQIFYLLNCRSLRDSVLRIGLFSNRAVLAGIGALLSLQAAFVYAPLLQGVFGTLPLSARDLAFSALVGAAVLPVIGLEKAVEARRRRP